MARSVPSGTVLPPTTVTTEEISTLFNKIKNSGACWCEMNPSLAEVGGAGGEGGLNQECTAQKPP